MSPDVLFIPAVVAIIHAAITRPAGNRNEFVLIIAVKGGDGIDTYHFSRGRSLNDVYTIAMGVAVVLRPRRNQRKGGSKGNRR